MQLSQKPARLISSLTGFIALAGCGRAPSFSILGSFFPAWLICLVTGIAVAASVNWILTALKQEKLITWGIITYPCLAAFVAIALWLIFFR